MPTFHDAYLAWAIKFNDESTSGPTTYPLTEDGDRDYDNDDEDKRDIEVELKDALYGTNLAAMLAAINEDTAAGRPAEWREYVDATRAAGHDDRQLLRWQESGDAESSDSIVMLCLWRMTQAYFSPAEVEHVTINAPTAEEYDAFDKVLRYYKVEESARHLVRLYLFPHCG